jgi:hypothetical protein
MVYIPGVRKALHELGASIGNVLDEQASMSISRELCF